LRIEYLAGDVALLTPAASVEPGFGARRREGQGYRPAHTVAVGKT
jgi:hypothetical protein